MRQIALIGLAAVLFCGCAYKRDLRTCDFRTCPDHYEEAIYFQYLVRVLRPVNQKYEKSVFCANRTELNMSDVLLPEFRASIGVVDLRDLKAANDLLWDYGRARNCWQGSGLRKYAILLDGANLMSRFSRVGY